MSRSTSSGHTQRRAFGLENLINTCYLNAILQNLSHTFVLEDLLRELHQTTKEVASAKLSPVLKELLSFFDAVDKTDGGGSVWPCGVLEAISKRAPRFQGNNQQDSHELLRHLIEGLKEEERELRKIADPALANDNGKEYHTAAPGNGSRRHKSTIADQVFGGYFLTVFHCKKCDVPYHLFEPFLDISLPLDFEEDSTTLESLKQFFDEKIVRPLANLRLRLPWSSDNTDDKEYKNAIGQMMIPVVNLEETRSCTQSAKQLQDSFAFYTRVEHLKEHLCINCNKGIVGDNYRLTEGTKQTIIYSPPAVLTVHLKRFKPIPIPTSASRVVGGYEKRDDHIPFGTVLDLAPFCSVHSQRQQKGSKNILYSLYGVVVHSGILQTGHYSACIRVRDIDVSLSKAFLQKELVDRESLMDKRLFVELMKNGPRYIESKLDHTETRWFDGTWYEISDSSVQEIDVSEVLKKQAYLLFYERIY